MLLLSGKKPETLSLTTPKGIPVEVAPAYLHLRERTAVCGVVKDGGDDAEDVDVQLLCDGTEDPCELAARVRELRGAGSSVRVCRREGGGEGDERDA